MNYIANWVKACAAEPVETRQEVHLLLPHPQAAEVARQFTPHVAGIHPYHDAAYLQLDCVFPVTHLLEAPFGAPWAGWIPDREDLHMPQMFDCLAQVASAHRAFVGRCVAELMPRLQASADPLQGPLHERISGS